MLKINANRSTIAFSGDFVIFFNIFLLFVVSAPGRSGLDGQNGLKWIASFCERWVKFFQLSSVSLYVENYDLLNTFQFISVKNIVRIAPKILTRSLSSGLSED